MPILATSNNFFDMMIREVNPVLFLTCLHNPSAHSEACEGYDIDAGNYGSMQNVRQQSKHVSRRSRGTLTRQASPSGF